MDVVRGLKRMGGGLFRMATFLANLKARCVAPLRLSCNEWAIEIWERGEGGRGGRKREGGNGE